MASVKNTTPQSRKKLQLEKEQLEELKKNPTVKLDLFTIMSAPEYELCLTKTLSSFKRERYFNRKPVHKRTVANRLHDLYRGEEGVAQFAVDYVLARNKKFVASSAIRRGVLEVGDMVVQEAAKQIAERLIIEKEAGIGDDIEVL